MVVRALFQRLRDPAHRSPKREDQKGRTFRQVQEPPERHQREVDGRTFADKILYHGKNVADFGALRQDWRQQRLARMSPSG